MPSKRNCSVTSLGLGASDKQVQPAREGDGCGASCSNRVSQTGAAVKRIRAAGQSSTQPPLPQLRWVKTVEPGSFSLMHCFGLWLWMQVGKPFLAFKATKPNSMSGVQPCPMSCLLLSNFLRLNREHWVRP